MRILITGATGFIGSNLLHELMRYDNIELIILVRNKSNLADIRSNDQVIEVDLLNKNLLKKKLASINWVDLTYNVAGRLSSSKYSYNNLRDSNVKIVKNLLECLRGKSDNFVHVSSAAAMGNQVSYVDENYICNPITDYDKVKYEGENIVREMCEILGINYVILRPTMVYGPGEIHTKLKLFKLINNRMFFIPGDGTNKMSWLYIDNFLSALGIFIHKTCNNEIYIISDENPYTLNEIVHSISDTLGVSQPIHLPHFVCYNGAVLCEYLSKIFKSEPILSKERLMNLVTERTYSINKAKSDLGYNPKVDLDDGIEKTVQWYKGRGLL